ncbi:hypothetical protein BDR07DRAFT_1492025 [Suillus spraguei]|nr:hypothetical protein BDR07DRAFT_1492025 [Suillus spraguei]
MSHILTRNLTFQSNDLGEETTIMLTFDANVKSLYEDFFPGQQIRQDGYIQYSGDLHEPVFDGNITDAGTSIKINDNQKTSLTEANDIYHFSTPESGTPGILQLVLAIIFSFYFISLYFPPPGFISPGDLMPKPVLCFSDVGDGSHVTARFTPVLRLYVTSGYREIAIIRAAIDTPAIWSQDLTGLDESATWTLRRDAATGHYTLVPS